MSVVTLPMSSTEPIQSSDARPAQMDVCVGPMGAGGRKRETMAMQ
jgi:hypothetical protein